MSLFQLSILDVEQKPQENQSECPTTDKHRGPQMFTDLQLCVYQRTNLLGWPALEQKQLILL